jgi:hypothetical protein
MSKCWFLRRGSNPPPYTILGSLAPNSLRPQSWRVHALRIECHAFSTHLIRAVRPIRKDAASSESFGLVFLHHETLLTDNCHTLLAYIVNNTTQTKASNVSASSRKK